MVGVSVLAGLVGAAVFASALQDDMLVVKPWRRHWKRWHDVADGFGWLAVFSPRFLVHAGIVAALLAIWMFGVLGFLLVVAVFVFGPRLLDRWVIMRRIRRFEQQLPAALDAIAAGLQAGRGLAQTVANLAGRFPNPVGAVLRDAEQQIRAGSDPGAALRRAGAAYPTREWHMFVDAVATLLRLGGNLAEITARAAETIRRRQRIQERLQTLTAQGRAQAWLMGALPLVMLLVLRAADPALFRLLIGTVAGWLVLMVAVVLEFVAVILMRRILAIEV